MCLEREYHVSVWKAVRDVCVHMLGSWKEENACGGMLRVCVKGEYGRIDCCMCEGVWRDAECVVGMVSWECSQT